jgi:polygalacturonase
MKTCIVSLWACSVAAFAAPNVCDVRDYGATGDGRTKDTQAIQKAIDACAQKGAGVVYIPFGNYLTGAITLKSNLILRIEAGATILASTDPEDYPLIPNPWQPENRQPAALINGEGLENVTITGRGTIEGQGKLSYYLGPERTGPVEGDLWGHHASQKYDTGYFGGKVVPSGDAYWGPRKTNQGSAANSRQYAHPRLIKLVRCTNAVVEGLTLRNSPSWTVNPVFCERVALRGLTIDNPMDSTSTDAIDLESCRDVHISDSTLGAGDDLVTIKSGSEPAGLRVNKPCENITVANCTMLHGHGAIVIGSETSGGVRNVSVSNCVFRGTDRGFRLKTQRGRGGVVDGLVASNIIMEDVIEPFGITLYYSGRGGIDKPEPVNQGTPVWRNLSFQNIIARGARTAGYLLGLPESPFNGVTFSDVRVSAKDGFSCRWAKDVAFHNVRIDTEEGSALTARDTEGLEIDGFRTGAPHLDVPVIGLSQVRDVMLRGSYAARGTGTFVDLSGDTTRNVVLSGNDLHYAKQAVNAANGLGQEIKVE